MLNRTSIRASLVAVVVIFVAVPANAITVINTNDSGGGSLRAALASAASGDTIDFAPGVTGTIALLSTLSVTLPVTIQGPGAANLTLDGQSTVRVLDVVAGGSLILSGLTIANGSTTGLGGGIQSGGMLTVSECVFTGNSADNGGAISNLAGSSLSVDECTFRNNKANAIGGGAMILFGPAVVSNSTFVGNMGPVNGGAINVQPSGSLMLVNCTLFDNSSFSLGGALSNLGITGVFDCTLAANKGSSGSALATGNANVRIDNSVLADNAASSSPGALSPSGGISGSHNVFFNNTAAGTPDDQTGYGTSNFVVATVEPLGPLGNHGGPTLTMLPLEGGAAICAGSVALLPNDLTRDQRGFPRTTFVGGAPCLDAGAVQLGERAAVPALSTAMLGAAVAMLAMVALFTLRRTHQ